MGASTVSRRDYHPFTLWCYLRYRSITHTNLRYMILLHGRFNGIKKGLSSLYPGCYLRYRSITHTNLRYMILLHGRFNGIKKGLSSLYPVVLSSLSLDNTYEFTIHDPTPWALQRYQEFSLLCHPVLLPSRNILDKVGSCASELDAPASLYPEQ